MEDVLGVPSSLVNPIAPASPEASVPLTNPAHWYHENIISALDKFSGCDVTFIFTLT